MKAWKPLLAFLLIFALLVGCSNATGYVQDKYPLVNVQGKGKTAAKIYEAEGKDVPTVAKELADQEKPKETSKTSQDQMFLVYPDKIINLQKNPDHPENTLVEVDTIEYARQNYDSSFLQGMLTAAVLHSVFGGGWFNNRQPSTYRGYTSVPRSYSPGGSYSSPNDSSGSSSQKPTTSDRTGSFGKDSGGTADSSSPGSNSIKKNDGSTPSYKSGSSSSSKPSTSSRSGSFSRKK